MGYYTHITGGASIVPPIDDAKMKHLTGDYGYFRFAQVPGDQTVQVVNGQVTVVGTNPGETSVELNFDDAIKGYDFHDHVQMLVDLAIANGSVANGQFDGDGEESGDNWRIIVTSNTVTSEAGSIIYPSDLKDYQRVAWEQGHNALCSWSVPVHNRPCPQHPNPYA